MRIIRFFLILVLFFVSTTAFWGGTVLIANAHGNPWGMMPLSLLAHSPFHSWLIPGLILISANGVLGLLVMWQTLRQEPKYGLWSALQGFVLMGWLAVECLFLRIVARPHYFYGALALLLILCGFALQHASDAHRAGPDHPAFTA